MWICISFLTRGQRVPCVSFVLLAKMEFSDVLKGVTSKDFSLAPLAWSKLPAHYINNALNLWLIKFPLLHTFIRTSSHDRLLNPSLGMASKSYFRCPFDKSRPPALFLSRRPCVSPGEDHTGPMTEPNAIVFCFYGDSAFCTFCLIAINYLKTNSA